MKKKACRQCRVFVDGNECPKCHSKSLSTNWQGRITFLDIENSTIAKKMEVEKKGEYAIKVR